MLPVPFGPDGYWRAWFVARRVSGLILEELTLRGWRSYREPRTFRFVAGVNLICGPNESGKSTILEALTRGFFDRHGSRTRELRGIVPLGSSLAPEVELVVAAPGRRWKARKRFLHEPEAQLWGEGSSGWQLDHEGDRADQELRTLLRGAGTKGGTKPEYRGLAQALWYLQGEDALPKGKGWEDAVDEGLRGTERQVLRTDLEAGLLARLEELLGTLFTPSGRVAAGGELGRLKKEVDELTAEVESAGGRLRRLADYRESLSQLELEAETARTGCLELTERIAAMSAAVSEARDVLRDRSRLEAEVARWVSDERAERSRLERSELRERNLVESRTSLERSQHELAEGLEVERHLAEALKELQSRWETRSSTGLRELEEEARGVRADEESRRLEAELIDVRDRLRGIAAEQAEIARLVAARSALVQIDEDRWTALQMLGRRIEALETARRERALLVRVVRLEEDLPVEVAPTPRSVDGEHLSLSEPTVLTLGTVAEVHIEAGNRRVDGALDQAREQQCSLLSELGVAEPEEVERLRSEGREIDQQLRVLRAAFERRTDSQQNLVRRERELVERVGRVRSEQPQGVLPGFDGATSGRSLRVVEEDLAEARRTLDEEGRQIGVSRLKLEECRRANEELRQRIADMRTEIANLEGEQTNDLAGRSLSDLASSVEVMAAGLAGAKQQLTANRTMDSEGVLKEFTRLESQRADAERRLRSLDEAMTDRKARRNELLDLGVRGRLGELEARLAERQRRLAVISERSEAARVLSQLASAWDERGQNVLAAPVSEWVDRWWRRIAGESAGRVVLGPGLIPIGVRGRDGVDEMLDFDLLSYGAAALLVVLVRLAIGFVLGTEERQLVVLDDRLVDVDGQRLAAFGGVLAEASERCQLVIATCHAEHYEGVEANRIDLGSHADVSALVSRDPVGTS